MEESILEEEAMQEEERRATMQEDFDSLEDYIA